MGVTKQPGFLSASEAARELGVSLPTLYSYVSRGLLRSEQTEASKRARRYIAEDVQRLKARQELRKDPKKVVDTALHWGMPMLESAVTLIEGGHCYYRGQEITALATHATLEQTAALLWTGEPQQADALFTQSPTALPSNGDTLLMLLRDATPIERFQAVLALGAADDLAAYDFRPAQVARTGARLLRCMTLLAIDSNTGVEEGIATTLQRAWAPERPETIPLFNAALILCADHELNVSSFTARCVASAGASPYSAVIAGLAALQGVKHGGASERVAALFRETAAPTQARATLAARIRRGEPTPGFGHPLYPEGDPRGRLLLDLTLSICAGTPGALLAEALAEAGRTALNEEPNVDFGLATLCAGLELPPGTAITLFALGRVVGWIGHAIEAYEADALIRPRAHYTGPRPGPSFR